MTSSSMPEYEQAPTYDEVIAYAHNEGLLGKVSIDRFYDYYSKQNFLYQGVLMDWKNKLHEWASKQRGTVSISAKEYAAQQRIPKTREFATGKGTTNNVMEYLNWAVAQI